MEFERGSTDALAFITMPPSGVSEQGDIIEERYSIPVKMGSNWGSSKYITRAPGNQHLNDLSDRCYLDSS